MRLPHLPLAVAIAGCLTGPALAAPPDSGAVAGGPPHGPDIIVTTIGPTLALHGTIDTDAGPDTHYVSAYTCSSVVCNRGDADAVWIDCTSGAGCNQHPVNARNLYRLHAGRFEQVGQSWVFHDYCAADAGPGCAPDGVFEPNGSCDWLGPGATTTNSVSNVAAPLNLGPRSEVNPWTGAFTYPYGLGWGQTGDPLYKRLQVRAADLNPALHSGALYFAEEHYIGTDEPPANRYNNVSYRRVIIGGGSGAGWNLSFTGLTFAQEPAISAWAAADPTVTIAAADVPDDGRFIIATRVSDRGHGTWRYEYAVYNMNSDRAAGAFSVPLAPAATAWNVGFHDVDYHSGEPYSGADWPAAIAGDQLAWQADSFAANPDANALRWGTLYNFRLDSTAAPVDGAGSLGLFKPGAVPAVSFAARVPAGPVCLGPQPGDANCDASLDFFDVDPFLLALFDNPAYLANAAWCGNNCTADVDGSGRVDFHDIDLFLACLFAVCP